jgi:hypothetical protein
MNPDTSISAYGLVNLTESEQSLTLPHNAGTDRLTGRTIGPEITLRPLEVLLLEVQPTSNLSTAEESQQEPAAQT